MSKHQTDTPFQLKVSDWPPLERFERAAGIAGIGHYVWDVVADRCLMCSDEHAAMHGMTRDEYIAQSSTIDGLAHPEDLPIVRDAFYRLQQGNPFEVEYRLIMPTGEIRYVREIGHPVFDEKGNVVQEIGTTQDITRQKRAEADLLKTQQILSEGFEALHLGFAFFDSDSRLQIFNQAYRDMLHISGHLLKPGLAMEDLLRVSAAVIAPEFGYDDPEEYIADRLAAAKTGDKGWTYRQSNGRWITIYNRPTQSGGFVSVLEDVTEAKLREEQLRQSQKMEAVGQLTGGIAHDFNNLLAIILGNAELLEDLDAELQPIAQDIIDATQRGAELTKGLLAFSRRQVLSAQPIALGTLLSEFLPLLVRTLGEDIELSFDHPDDLWTAFADPAQLENAVLNLALNSRAAMPQGGALRIQCRNVAYDGQSAILDDAIAPGNYVVIKVADTGTGMTQEQLDHAFEPFFTSKGVGEGTGLGLSSVFGFAKQSGGTARIAWTSETGTAVEIWLPKSDRNVQRSFHRKPFVKQRGEGERILVIEDDPGVQNLAMRVLNDAGYRPICVPDVQSARNIYAINQEIDLVLSDVVLPDGLSGPDFAEELRRGGAVIPFVFMTGYAHGVLDQDTAEGSAKVLRKPFARAELLAVIQEALAS